jgi:hypothetical protein
MPGLVRGVARTAVGAGTATAVSNRVSRRQAARWSQQSGGYEQVEPQYSEQPAPHAAMSSEQDKLDALKQLGDLKASGILNEAEFEAQKAKILAG